MRTAIDFIHLVEEATLASQFDPAELERLLNPDLRDSTIPEDPYLKLSVMNYLSFLTQSQAAYDCARENIEACFPGARLLTYYLVEKWTREFSGIIAWEHHMCVKTCIGFTGPYANLEQCPECGEPRYDQKELEESGGERKVPRQVFTTFPTGPQIQARWKHPQMAKEMLYRWERTQEILQEQATTGEDPGTLDDILCGQAYLNLVDEGVVGAYDTVLMLSVDGAQLYENKVSSCWVYIWILVDLGPDKRYKIRNVLPGGIIPGPGSPKDLDSFLFPGLAHLSALQNEGLPVWDAHNQRRDISHPFLFLNLADTLVMTQLSGSVGHHGRLGCRLLCGLIGRNKLHGSHYYPALLRPDGFDTHPTSAHPDLNVNTLPMPDPEEYKRFLFHVISSQDEEEFKGRRFNTGITKPSIFAGVPRTLPLPTCFPGDLMHQPLINLAALLLDLWCARPAARKYDRDTLWPWAVLTGEAWEIHGKVVWRAAKYLPTSFGRPPRNPQEKISSGYKAWEFLNYIYGEGPGVFYQVLPDLHYSHFCQLVRAIRIIFQHTISREQLIEAHQLLLQWVVDFELIYCQRKPNRLHFVRQCVHSLTHLARETYRLGPLWLSSQWTMERVIGYLGELLRQPSNIYRNFAAQARRVAITNALVAMWPDLEKAKREPHGSKDLGGGYVLQGPKDTTSYELPADKYAALETFFSNYPGGEDINIRTVYRWGRLKIPTEQIARSRWKEMERCSNMARADRNIKVCNYLDAICHLSDVA